MNALETAIKHALELSGAQTEANKAYLEFIKANFLIPIEKSSSEEEPVVLYLSDEHNYFLPVFSNRDYLNAWAQDIGGEISVLTLTGVNLLKGIGREVTVCLNIGSSIYKEFNPSEIGRMQDMVLKLFKD